ncbi:MAG: hypothetical protein ACYDAG_12435 [Chloroflexota bacterium]
MHFAFCIFVLTLVAYVALTPRIMWRLDPVTGDEPFYMMTAHNILAGRGLDETVSWRNHDFLAFYPPKPLPANWQGWPAFPWNPPPHTSIGTVPPGLYSKHGLGLSVLIVPFYAIGKRLPIVLFINVIGALTATNVYLLARETIAGLKPTSERPSRLAGAAPLFIWLAFSFSNPLMTYSYLIFPEIVAALPCVYAFRRIRAADNNPFQVGGIALAIAFLPWLHPRFFLLSAALFLYWFWKHYWRPGRFGLKGVLALLPIAISAAGLLHFYYTLYRSFLPNEQDHGGGMRLGSTVAASAGLLVDQQWGLLIHAPVYLLALAGIVAFWRRRRGEAVWWLLLVLPYYALIANYHLWWGEWCPPARYLVSVLPLFSLPLAVVLGSPGLAVSALDRLRRAWTWGTALVLALAGWVVMAVFMYDPQLMYNQPTGKSVLLAFLHRRGLPDLRLVLPAYVHPRSLSLDRGWSLALLAALLVLTVLLAGRKPVDGWREARPTAKARAEVAPCLP